MQSVPLIEVKKNLQNKWEGLIFKGAGVLSTEDARL